MVQPNTNDNDYGVDSIVDKRNAPNVSQCLGYEFCLLSGRVDVRMSSSLSGNGVSPGGQGPDLRDGNLHHVALTVDRDSHTGGVLYVDGQAVGTFDPTSQNGSLSNNQPLCLGYQATASIHATFNGRIDEVSIYNAALSAGQITAIYQAGVSGKCPPSGPPIITVQPVGAALGVGQSTHPSVRAIGSEPLAYQWQFGGMPLPGQRARRWRSTMRPAPMRAVMRW